MESADVVLMKSDKFDIVSSIRQDVLLIAGSKATKSQLNSGASRYECTRTHARSPAVVSLERAHNHCQVGNYGLAFRTLVNWLDEMQP